MHLVMIIVAIALAWCVRLTNIEPTETWTERWQRSLFVFLFPPLLLLTTTLAVICMGFQGKMLGIQATWVSYAIALGFVAIAGVLLLKLGYQGYLAGKQVRTYSQQLVAGKTARILKTNFPYSAAIGFWQPELVISEGLLNSLDTAHLEAVLAHEEAHYYYRDTFCFFWLGWLRSTTSWLPNTEALWQELLLLREVRADRRAAQQVDGLLLAESLLMVAKAPLMRSPPEPFAATFSCAVPRNRLAERIDALLAEPESSSSSTWYFWSGMLLVLLPLVTVVFHY